MRAHTLNLSRLTNTSIPISTPAHQASFSYSSWQRTDSHCSSAPRYRATMHRQSGPDKILFIGDCVGCHRILAALCVKRWTNLIWTADEDPIDYKVGVKEGAFWARTNSFEWAAICTRRDRDQYLDSSYGMRSHLPGTGKTEQKTKTKKGKCVAEWCARNPYNTVSLGFKVIANRHRSPHDGMCLARSSIGLVGSSRLEYV
jgi:hypothetical protein